MTNNKHKEIMETELKEWEGKEIFTLGDKECLPMLKNSLKRVLTEQLEEIEKCIPLKIQEAIDAINEDAHLVIREPAGEIITQILLSHLHSKKEEIKKV